jgi:bifunctional non-homologous end joining protein LigD
MKKNLQDYNKKRDFKINKEPSGAKAKSSATKKNKPLLFVVQEHHASHLHYDFRLELDGVLKSWAVPKGPSMHPEDKRLAVEVEDHPLSYAGFHGKIPAGQYGAGEVYIWDKGTWLVKGDPHESLEKGKLEFSLKGKKLKGNFVLVRLPDRGKNKNNWLLMKRTDEEALSGTEERAHEIPKNLKKNHKNWPGFISPQLAMLVDSPPSENHYVHEIKFDGYRLQPHIKNDEVKIFTRNGHDWSEKFPTLTNAMKDIDVESAILDGEAIVQDKEGKSDFGMLQTALSLEDDSNIKIFLFDC